MDLPVPRVVEEYGAGSVLETARIGHPAAVRRPADSEIGEAAVGHPHIVIDLGGPAALGVVDPDRLGVVHESDLLAVGRPLRLVAEAVRERCQLLLLSGAVRGAEGELVLAGPIAPVGDLPAVG